MYDLCFTCYFTYSLNTLHFMWNVNKFFSMNYFTMSFLTTFHPQCTKGKKLSMETFHRTDQLKCYRGRLYWRKHVSMGEMVKGRFFFLLKKSRLTSKRKSYGDNFRRVVLPVITSSLIDQRTSSKVILKRKIVLLTLLLLNWFRGIPSDLSNSVFTKVYWVIHWGILCSFGKSSS